MKRDFQYLLSLIFLFAFSILLSNNSQAQFPAPNPNTDSNGNVTTDGPDSASAPIDGGIALLLAAGVGYGVKKHRENRKKKTVNVE